MGRLKKPPSKLAQEESSSVLGIAGELLKQEIELDAEMGRRSFREFIPLVWEQVETSDFVHDWYIDIIAEHLEAVAKFEIKELVICIPPRHTKSLLVSVLFPSWVWVQDPKLKFVFSSYAHSLALRDALRTRRLIESEWFQSRWPTVKVTKDQNRVEKYELTKGGCRFSTSVQGQLTGEGGDFSICFPYHEEVWTNKGKISIGRIVDEKLEVLVYSVDLSNGSVELKPIEGYIKNKDSQFVKVHFSDGSSIECTPDHKFWTTNGWVEAQYLSSPGFMHRLLQYSKPATGQYGFVSVIKVDEVEQIDYSYCLTVSDNHNMIVGKGKGFIVANCDDPHNVKEAESDIVRKGTVTWWKESMSSRMNNLDKSSKVIIQQRVHQGDLAGEMIEEGYKSLVLPAYYEPDHPQKSIFDIRSSEEEILSKRFTKESLEKLRASLGEYAFAGQYQQRPAPRGGGQFKDNFKTIKKEHLPPKFDKIINGWDFAASENNTSDWTVRVKMGRVKDKVFGDLFYVLHVKRFRASGGKLRNEIKSIVESDGDEVLNDFPLDPAAAGKEWATTLRMDLMGYAMVFSPERGDKVLRSQGYASVVELGNVYLVEADWNKDFVSEHINFPAATYDDQVDAGGRAFRRHTFGRKLHIPKPANDPLRTNTIDPTKKTGYSGIEKGNAQDMVQEGKKRSKYSPRWHGGW